MRVGVAMYDEGGAGALSVRGWPGATIANGAGGAVCPAVELACMRRIDTERSLSGAGWGGTAERRGCGGWGTGGGGGGGRAKVAGSKRVTPGGALRMATSLPPRTT